MATQRLTYAEAAKALGISTDAARMRVRRGTLQSERDETGTVRVILNVDEIPTVETNDLISVLREQLAEEREARRRADTIILNLTQANATLASRVPALQAADDERREDSISRDDPVEGYPNTPRPRGWWKRIIGG
jgi:hypothetical protein